MQTTTPLLSRISRGRAIATVTAVAAATYGEIIPAEILVTLHESWNAGSFQENRITTISLVARMVTQQG